MNVVNLSIKYDEKLWNEIVIEADEQGKIYLKEDEYVQILPFMNANFISDIEAMIDIVFNISSQLALGLFVNWLYDKLKETKHNKILINNIEHEIIDKKSLEIVLNINIDEQ